MDAILMLALLRLFKEDFVHSNMHLKEKERKEFSSRQIIHKGKKNPLHMINFIGITTVCENRSLWKFHSFC